MITRKHTKLFLSLLFFMSVSVHAMEEVKEEDSDDDDWFSLFVLSVASKVDQTHEKIDWNPLMGFTVPEELELIQKFEHGSKVKALACSLDGRTVVSLGEDNSLKVWNKGGLTQEFDCDGQTIQCSDGYTIGSSKWRGNVWNLYGEIDYNSDFLTPKCHAMTEDYSKVFLVGKGGTITEFVPFLRVKNDSLGQDVNNLLYKLAQAIRKKQKTMELGPEEYASYQWLDESEFEGSIGRKIEVVERGKEGDEIEVQEMGAEGKEEGD